MMARSIDEIIDLKRKLKKETSSDGVLDILKVLDKLQVTRKILEDTRIGKTIAKIATKSNFADEVTALAKSLLKRWKKTAKMERNSTSPKGAEDTAIPKDETRKKVCYMFKETFTGKENGIDEGKNTGRELEISVQIETAMFNAYGSDPQAKEYKAKFRSLKFNLGKNEHIRNQLLEGTVKPEELVSMKPAELASPEKQKKIAEVMQSEFDKARSDYLDANRDKINEQAGIEKVGGLIKCEVCRSSRTTHYQKQTRGADEPMTVFAQCIDCGHNWRFGDH